MKDKNDNVYHPKHYQIPGLPVESIVIIRAILGAEGFKKFCRGNAMKYLIRADNKGGIEDLKKARVYLNWEIGDGKEASDDMQPIEAAKVLKAYCPKFENCEGCVFESFYGCGCTLGEHVPSLWKLPQDGLEQAEETEQAENINTIQAAKAIISHCDSQRGCVNCEFFNSVRQSCRFSDSPNMWILPRQGNNDIDGEES